jgi:methylenetetrahydrofolate reductase (NADH)
MRITDMLAGRPPVFSFEFFPPDTDTGTEALFRTIAELRELQPAFVSVTCRNHSRTRTLELVCRIRNDIGLEPMAHYTCAGATLEELHTTLRALQEAGIDNVLALRGDPPRGETAFRPVEGGLGHGSDLAAMIRRHYDFCVGGACYPEGHTESASREEDIRHTVRKVESGVDFLITQLFFDNAAYVDFLARARAAGITVPIIPGIMPITSVRQISRFESSFFGARLPERLREALLRRPDDAEAVVQLGIAWATLQCAELLAGGAPGIHFYTLNRSPATRTILSALLAARPWERAEAGRGGVPAPPQRCGGGPTLKV